MSALSDYLDFILRPTNAGLISINDAIHVLAPLGIEWRLVCRARMVPSEGSLLVVNTSDPSPVLSVHDRAHPAKGRPLERR